MNNKTKKINTYKDFKLFDTGGDLFSGSVDVLKGSVNNASTLDTKSLEASIRQNKNAIVSSGNNSDLMQAWGTHTNMPHVSARDVGAKSFGDLAMGTLQTTASGAAAGTAVAPGIGSIIGAGAGLLAGVSGGIVNRIKANKKSDSVNNQIDKANAYQQLASANQINNVDTRNNLNMLANYSAEGGTIHIDPANKGKFNATKVRTGKTTEELTHSKNPLTRKRAIFAQNAAKWHHANGGPLQTNTDNFSNGVTEFNSGGTHEINPNDGIQQGIDGNGIPNLVEEGEVKYNNYIYSNRLQYDDKHTFADMAKKLSKESKERPNDFISKNYLDKEMGNLQQAQEIFKQFKDNTKPNNSFGRGGKMYSEGDPLNLGVISTGLEANNYTPTGVGEAYNLPIFGNSNSLSTQDVNNTLATLNPVKKDTGYIAPVHRFSKARYAPIVGSGIMAATDLLGLTNKPDYSNANNIQATPVSPEKVGNYLAYQPFDREFYLNKLDTMNNATRRAVIDQSAGNRATATAGILAANYGAQSQFGNLARQAEEYNLAQRQNVEEFNRGTNQFNAQAQNQAAMFNSEAALKANMARAELRDNILGRSSTAKSANLTNFLDNLGALGNEDTQKGWLDYLAKSGVLKVDTNGNYVSSKATGGFLNNRRYGR